MEKEYIKNSEAQKVTLLEKINQVLAELGSTAKWKRAPEFLESWAPLKNKNVTMVDDTEIVLENFAPYLIVATNGKASFIKHTEQEPDELVRQIMEYSPDIVLMDYNLSKNLKGADVVRMLKEKDFTGEVVGFSSDRSATDEFMDAGAKGVVHKDAYDLEKSVEELARVISKK